MVHQSGRGQSPVLGCPRSPSPRPRGPSIGCGRGADSPLITLDLTPERGQCTGALPAQDTERQPILFHLSLTQKNNHPVGNLFMWRSVG